MTGPVTKATLIAAQRALDEQPVLTTGRIAAVPRDIAEALIAEHPGGAFISDTPDAEHPGWYELVGYADPGNIRVFTGAP